jgi:hypothetical protein
VLEDAGEEPHLVEVDDLGDGGLGGDGLAEDDARSVTTPEIGARSVKRGRRRCGRRRGP